MITKVIYEHAKLHVDGDFPLVHALRWLNEAQRLIAMTCETGAVLDSASFITTEENKWYSLPSNKVAIKNVYYKGQKVNDYREDGIMVQLPSIGEYIVEYKRIAKDMARESETPELHELYHFPISYWIASREQFRFNPDNPDGQRLENTFYQEIMQVDSTLKKSNRVRHIKV